MTREAVLKEQLAQITAIADLTAVFEGIAGMQISTLRDQTLSSKQFFAELWNIYSKLRATETSRLTSERNVAARNKLRRLFVVITSQGGLSGDIDSRVVERMMHDYDPSNTDVIVVGGHGSALVAQRGVEVLKHYKMPEPKQGFGTVLIEPIIGEALRHGHTY